MTRSNFAAFFKPSTLKNVKCRLFVYSRIVDTIFNVGYGSVKSSMGLRVNKNVWKFKMYNSF